MSIVTESEMSSTGQLRLTEKTFKPLAMGHPILLCGNKGSLKRLREQGFRTFAPFVDESYDDIEDGPSRIHRVHAEMLRLSALSNGEFAEGMASLRDIVIHNALHFHHGYDALQWLELASLQSALTKDFGPLARCD